MQQIQDALELIHQRLLRLEGPFLGPEDEEGDWHVVPARPTKGKKEFQPVDKNKLSPKMVKEAVGMFNAYWKELTGRDIHFNFRGPDMNFLSVSEPSLYRDVFLRRHFKNRPVIVDVFGGVGGDAITFLYMLNPVRIDIIEMLQTAEDRERISLLNANVDNFKKAFSEFPMSRIEHNVFDYSFEHYMTVTPPTHIDLLYLDPPWALHGKKESSPQEIFEYLNTTVFSNLISNAIRPRVICIKTRFGWEDCKVIMRQVPDYFHVDTTHNRPFKGEYFFHTMVENKAEVSRWIHSVAYDKVHHQQHIEEGRVPPDLLPTTPLAY